MDTFDYRIDFLQKTGKNTVLLCFTEKPGTFIQPGLLGIVQGQDGSGRTKVWFPMLGRRHEQAIHYLCVTDLTYFSANGTRCSFCGDATRSP